MIQLFFSSLSLEDIIIKDKNIFIYDFNKYKKYIFKKF